MELRRAEQEEPTFRTPAAAAGVRVAPLVYDAMRPSPLWVRVRKLIMGLWLSRRAENRWRLPVVGTVKARVRYGRGATLQVGDRLQMGEAGTGIGQIVRGLPVAIELAPGARLVCKGRATLGDGTILLVGREATLSLGKDVYFDGDTRILCAKSVIIGDEAKIGWGVTIMDTDLHMVDGRPEWAPITIGAGAWIGVDAKIMKGVTIGEKAVVAAGAVVIRDVPAGALVGGVPAKIVREHVTFD